MINFREFYNFVSEKREEAGYFPTVKKYLSPRGRDGWQIPGALKSVAKGLQGMGSDYNPIFKQHEKDPFRPKSTTDIYSAKTVSEQRKLLAEWRKENITSKDNSAEETRLKDQLMQDDDVLKIYASDYTPERLRPQLEQIIKIQPELKSEIDIDTLFTKKKVKEADGTIKDTYSLNPRSSLPFMVLVDAAGRFDGIVDGKYKASAGAALPKEFDRPGHYANQVIDSIDTYMGRGYSIDEAKNIARSRFNPKGQGYLDTVYHIDTLR